MSRQVLLRSLGRCCLGLLALLVAGGAAGMLLAVSLSCPLPTRRTHPPAVVCCFRAFAEIGVTSTKSGRLEVNLGSGVGRAIWEQNVQIVVQADLNLQLLSKCLLDCSIADRFSRLRGRELYVRAVKTGRAIPMQEFTADLKHRMRGVWRDTDKLVDTHNNKLATGTYHS